MGGWKGCIWCLLCAGFSRKGCLAITSTWPHNYRISSIRPRVLFLFHGSAAPGRVLLFQLSDSQQASVRHSQTQFNVVSNTQSITGRSITSAQVERRKCALDANRLWRETCSTLSLPRLARVLTSSDLGKIAEAANIHRNSEWLVTRFLRRRYGRTLMCTGGVKSKSVPRPSKCVTQAQKKNYDVTRDPSNFYFYF